MDSIFDFVIIGTSTESVLIGNALTSAGKSVLVIEQNPVTNFHSDSFLSDLPDLTAPPIVFEKGGFQKFVGFGENAPDYYEWLMPYLTPKTLSAPKLPNSNIKVLTNSSVTGLEAEDNRIQKVIVNGKDKIMGYHFISTLNPLKTIKWSKFFSPKLLHRWNKQPLWSTLVLDLAHNEPLTNKSCMQLLRGNKNEFCLGYFKNQNSHWMSFLPTGEELNTELVGSLYREMKRLIAKSYPQCFQSLNFEKLTVVSESHGHLPFKIEQENPLAPFKNLWLCNTKLTKEFDILKGCGLAVHSLLEDYSTCGLLGKSNGFEHLGEAEIF